MANQPLTAEQALDIITYDITGLVPNKNNGEVFVKEFCRDCIDASGAALEAYAMAHNAMLREALTNMRGRFSHDEKYRLDALNATEAEATAWLKAYVCEVGDTLAAQIVKLEEQLATVTNERDALRASLRELEGPARLVHASRVPQLDLNANHGAIFWGLVHLGEALAQKGGESCG